MTMIKSTLLLGLHIRTLFCNNKRKVTLNVAQRLIAWYYGEQYSARWQHWSRMKDVSFCFEKILRVEDQNKNSFSSGTSTAP